MRIIKLERGEVIKIIGDKETFMIITNIDGEVYAKTGWNREFEEEKAK